MAPSPPSPERIPVGTQTASVTISRRRPQGIQMSRSAIALGWVASALLLGGSVGAQSIGGGSSLGSAHTRPASLRAPVFTLPVEYELAGAEPKDTEVGDMDGDGHLDILTSGTGSVEVSVVYGDGTGDFSDGDDFVAIFQAFDPGPAGLALGDFNGDGTLDVGVTLGASYDGLGNPNTTSNVFLSDGNRNYTFTTEVHTLGMFPIDCASADFDLDGFQDLAVISNSSGGSVFKSLGDGQFAAGVPFTGSGGGMTSGLVLETEDFDSDGNPDLVLGGSFGRYILWGSGTSTYDYSTGYYLGPDPSFACADVNGDGLIDVLGSVADRFPNYTGGVWTTTNNGDRTFAFRGADGPSIGGSIAAGDLNGDGWADAIVLSGFGSARPYLGSRHGSFLDLPTLSISFDPVDIKLGDWDEDGRLDIASPRRNLGDTPFLAVLLNRTP